MASKISWASFRVIKIVSDKATILPENISVRGGDRKDEECFLKYHYDLRCVHVSCSGPGWGERQKREKNRRIPELSKTNSGKKTFMASDRFKTFFSASWRHRRARTIRAFECEQSKARGKKRHKRALILIKFCAGRQSVVEKSAMMEKNARVEFTSAISGWISELKVTNSSNAFFLVLFLFTEKKEPKEWRKKWLKCFYFNDHFDFTAGLWVSSVCVHGELGNPSRRGMHAEREIWPPSMSRFDLSLFFGRWWSEMSN